jgi:hypothetical protein
LRILNLTLGFLISAAVAAVAAELEPAVVLDVL